MDPLEPALQRYEWGTSDDLPEYLGFPPDGGPYAEAWWGAHPAASAVVGADGADTLDERIGRDPEAALGPDVGSRFGASLPYLLKVLAIAKPLSIQVHPSRDTARSGFAREEAAGIPRNAPERVYRDENHKPEMILALTPMVLLSGFRSGPEVRGDLEAIGGPVAARLAALCLDDGGSLEAYVRGVLTDDEAHGLVSDLAFVGAHRGAGENLRAAARAASHFRGDRGALVALAMNVVRLEPGEACFTSDGIVHSYQSGVGLEIMANSDNVIRAGLTPKHIDVDALLEVSVLTPTAPARILPTPAGDAAAYRPPAEEFGLLIVDDGEVETPPGPRIVLGLEGQTRVSTDAGSLVLSKGAAVFVPHADGGARVRSTGKAAVALVP